jgi:hypothetical protein
MLMRLALLLSCLFPVVAFAADDTPRIVSVEGQPLGANIARLTQTLEFLGAPFPNSLVTKLTAATKKRDAKELQKLLDPHATFVVSLNPEVRVKVERGPGKATIQQGGFTPLIVKVINESTVTRQLRIRSPQAGPVYSGAALAILKRQAQTELNENENVKGKTDRFLEVDLFQKPPMTMKLSGLEVEYAVALIYSQESGKREATIEFDVGAGTQDIGFRGEVPVLFDIRPAIAARLAIRDFDGEPTTARLTIRDKYGRVYPPQAKRLAPDFFFQKQIYRHDGAKILLPPGDFQVEYSRGPEYHVLSKVVRTEEPLSSPKKIPAGVDLSDGAGTFTFNLKRWVTPSDYGFYSGDHHIHGAGCSHYESPTEGVRPIDMFAQVKGEGLNVGCILTWGPCFDFQRDYFNPFANKISEPKTIIKYDLEISGFGSAALGHVCLLNLKNQTYPQSEGTKTKGWPTWTVPVLKWCKDQGGVTGYPHSAMHVNPASSARRWLNKHDADKSASISKEEASKLLMPEPFSKMDEDRDGSLTERELVASFGRAANELPNLAVPDMSGGGALEICVSTAEGVCDFISAMDTARIPEWNTWYHLMNCGFPLKLSGETDFPCMSSRRVGQGRVYVQLGKVKDVDFTDWCNGIAAGRSYVSDGYAHALKFEVDGKTPGTKDVSLAKPGQVNVRTTVAFAPRTPVGVAYGNVAPATGRRMLGDTINLHAPRSEDYVTGGRRLVEIVVNGEVVASREVPADGKTHDLEFPVEITQSSWVAVRHFPQLHSNPVNVIVDEKPIRVSADSARWCIETIHELWRNRHQRISEPERPAARAAYDRAILRYEQIAADAASR